MKLARFVVDMQMCAEERGGLLPWYYGRTWYEFHALRTIYHPIPLNYVLRGLQRLQIWWNKVRSQPSDLDEYIEGVARWNRQKGFERGYGEGMEKGIKRTLIVLGKR